MEFKITTIIICFLICLFSIACAYAGDVENGDVLTNENSLNETSKYSTIDISSENNSKIDSTTGISSENGKLIKSQDDSTTGISSENGNLIGNHEADALAYSPGSFADLNQTINGNEEIEINLTRDYIFTNSSDSDFIYGINISRGVSINGNGHVINGSDYAKIFNVENSSAVFNNIIFSNGNPSGNGPLEYFHGGAIKGKCTAFNCTFLNNKPGTEAHIKGWGGAMYLGTAINCTFAYNGIMGNCTGGAIYGGIAINCSFRYNKGSAGGAISLGKAINCIFEYNQANFGGAVASTNSTNCTFNKNFIIDKNEDKGGGAMSGGSATDCNFTGNYASYSGGAIYGGTAINCNFTGNHAEWGGATKDTTVANSTFIDNYLVSYFSIHVLSGGSASGGSATGCTFINSNATNGGALYYASASNCTFINCSATNGGALYSSSASNCTFINCSATNGGGLFSASASNCTFINCNATNGGAMMYGSASNCTFINNSAQSGGAKFKGGNASGCTFINNTAAADGGAISQSSAISCEFIGNSAANGGALSEGNASDCTFINNTAEKGAGINKGTAANCTFINNTASSSGGAINNGTSVLCNFENNSADGQSNDCSNTLQETPTIEIPSSVAADYGSEIEIPLKMAYNGYYFEGLNLSIQLIKDGELINESQGTSGSSWTGFLEAGEYTLNVEFTSSSPAQKASSSISVSGIKTIISAGGMELIAGEIGNLTATLTDANGNPLSSFNLTVSDGSCSKSFTTDGEGMIVIPLANLTEGEHAFRISFSGKDAYEGSNASANVKVQKIQTKIIASAVTAVYKNSRYLTATLMDESGNVLANAELVISLNGASRVLNTNSKGQVRLSTTGLSPKKYVARISYGGDYNHSSSSLQVKVVVKKARAKIYVKKRTAKAATSKKRFRFVLKNHKKQAIKKARISLRVNKKTYYAKTNKKGKVVFKIAKLNKKGKYKAVIRYKGNKYYKKAKRTIKLIIK